MVRVDLTISGHLDRHLLHTPAPAIAQVVEQEAQSGPIAAVLDRVVVEPAGLGGAAGGGRRRALGGGWEVAWREGATRGGVADGAACADGELVGVGGIQAPGEDGEDAAQDAPALGGGVLGAGPAYGVDAEESAALAAARAGRVVRDGLRQCLAGVGVRRSLAA